LKMPSLFTEAILRVLSDYVARNMGIVVKLDLPSLEERKTLCNLTGLGDKQLIQWFFRTKRKCSPELIKQFVLCKIGSVGNTGVGATHIMSSSGGRALNSRKAESSRQPRKTAFTPTPKPASPVKVERNTRAQKPSPRRVLFDEIQLATLEQSWHRGLIQNPINHAVVCTITGLTMATVKEWGENRTRLGEGYLFQPEERHFEELHRRLARVGLLDHEGVSQIVAVLAKQSEEATARVARNIVLENAKQSGLLSNPEIQADMAILMKMDISEVKRLAHVHIEPKKEPMDEDPKEEQPKYQFITGEALPEQPLKVATVKRERTPDDADPEWVPQMARNRPSRPTKRQKTTGRGSGSAGYPKKRRQGFSAETYQLLNHAWNTQLITKPEMHHIIATLANISVKQLKTWVSNKRHRNPGFEPVKIGTAGSRKFSDTQKAVLTRAFDMNLLNGKSRAIIAELAQMTNQQVKTWAINRRHRGPHKRY